MEAFLYLVVLPAFFFLILIFIFDTIKKFLQGTPLSKEIKIPDGMRVDSEVRKDGGKYKGVIRITFTQTIRIVNKPHPVEANTEDELNQKTQDIINKYIIK
jgi:hypothetical protein